MRAMRTRRWILLLLCLPALSLAVEENGKPQPPLNPAPNGGAEKGDDSWISVVPKGAASVNKEGWKTRTFTILNLRKKDFYVYGHGNENPFIQMETKDPKTGNWGGRFFGYCGTGAAAFRVKPGETFSATVSLPADQADREFSFNFECFSKPDGGSKKTVKSPSLWMGK